MKVMIDLWWDCRPVRGDHWWHPYFFCFLSWGLLFKKIHGILLQYIGKLWLAFKRVHHSWKTFWSLIDNESTFVPKKFADIFSWTFFFNPPGPGRIGWCPSSRQYIRTTELRFNVNDGAAWWVTINSLGLSTLWSLQVPNYLNFTHYRFHSNIDSS